MIALITQLAATTTASSSHTLLANEGFQLDQNLIKFGFQFKFNKEEVATSASSLCSFEIDCPILGT